MLLLRGSKPMLNDAQHGRYNDGMLFYICRSPLDKCPVNFVCDASIRAICCCAPISVSYHTRWDCIMSFLHMSLKELEVPLYSTTCQVQCTRSPSSIARC